MDSFLAFALRWTLAMLLAGVLVAPGAHAQQVIHGASCAGDKFGSDLVCNANDVAITQIAINRNYYPGVNVTPQANLLTGAGCVGGTKVVTNLNVTVQFNNPDRYDIGIFLAEDGGNPQLLKSSAGSSQACTVSILPLNTASGGAIPNPFGTGTVPTPFLNLNNASGAYCGDGASTTIPTAAYASATGTAANTGTATFVIYDVPIPCSANGGTGKLNIPFVVSWSQLASNVCTSPANAVPGTKSKCNAPSGTLAEVDVVTLPSITKSNGVTSVSVGDTTTYTITVSNTTGGTIASQVIKDPAITGLQVTGVTCAAAGGVTCPAVTPATFATGVTVNSMPNASTLTFSVNGKYTSTGTTPATWVPAANSQIVNTATTTVGGVSNSAIDADVFRYPNLSNRKTVSIVSDPVRGLVSNAAAIPGAVAQYSITVENTDPVGKADANSILIDDAVPPETALYYALAAGATNCSAVGSPVSLSQGSTTSTLTLVAADIDYSADYGANYGATPAWTFVPASGTQPPGCVARNITNVRASPKGRMAAASSFTLNFNVVVR